MVVDQRENQSQLTMPFLLCVVAKAVIPTTAKFLVEMRYDLVFVLLQEIEVSDVGISSIMYWTRARNIRHCQKIDE